MCLARPVEVFDPGSLRCSAIATFADIPSAYDGSAGTNRRPAAENTLLANRDWDALQRWLQQLGLRQPALESYGREAERLFRWSIGVADKPLSSLDADDLRRYDAFVRSPDPDWRMRSKYRRKDSRWRPFFAQRSEAGATFSRHVLRRLFVWLTAQGYLRSSPLQAARK